MSHRQKLSNRLKMSQRLTFIVTYSFGEICETWCFGWAKLKVEIKDVEARQHSFLRLKKSIPVDTVEGPASSKVGFWVLGWMAKSEGPASPKVGFWVLRWMSESEGPAPSKVELWELCWMSESGKVYV